MRKYFIVTAAALAICMIMPAAGLLTGTQAEVCAAEKTGDMSGTVEEIADQFGDPANDPFGYTSDTDRKKALKKAAKTLPAQFDLRNVNGVSYVTPVKFQNPWGNCWGFAAIAAAETSILGDPEFGGKYTSDKLDLSEKQLTYFSRVPINDPKNPQNGEGMAPIVMPTDDDPVSAAYNMGGQAPTATSVMATGMGPVLESENPLFLYQGAKGMKQSEWVDGKYQFYCYSPSDDWALDESLRFSHSFDLRESYAVPSPAKVDTSGEENKYEYDPAGTAAIKEQLYQKRGVQIGYKDDTFNPAYTDHGDYINSNYAHYTYEPHGARHAVCIVGWNDNYPKENFRHAVDDPDYTEADTIPPGDGAWLVKNSWGSGEEQFPNKGEGTWGIVNPATGKHTGYFWLSYYDQSIRTPEALDLENRTETDVTDQHDYMPIDSYLAARVNGEVSTANIFKASVCEEVQQVSCETTYPNTEVTFDVYLLADQYTSPTEGIRMDSVTATFQYGGFHKVDLNKPFMVMRNQSYAIVVTQKVPQDSGGQAYTVSMKMSTGNGVVNKGESFLLADGAWLDFSDKKLQKKLLSQTEDPGAVIGIDNFPIKGFGEQKPDIVLEVDYSGSIVVPSPEDEEKPVAYFKAWLTCNTESDHTGSVVPKWEIAKGGEDIIDLADGRDPTRKTLTCKKLGWTYLIIRADGIGTVIRPIKVSQPSPYISSTKAGKKRLDLKLQASVQEGLSGYEVLYRVKGTSKWSRKEFDAKAGKLRIKGLKTGKRYEVKVRSFVDSAPGRYYSSYSIKKVSKKIR